MHVFNRWKQNREILIKEIKNKHLIGGHREKQGINNVCTYKSWKPEVQKLKARNLQPKQLKSLH